MISKVPAAGYSLKQKNNRHCLSKHLRENLACRGAEAKRAAASKSEVPTAVTNKTKTTSVDEDGGGLRREPFQRVGKTVTKN